MPGDRAAPPAVLTGAAPCAPVPPSLVEAIRDHPDFPAAMAVSVVELVGAHTRNRLLSRLISDRGRAVFGIYALYLHYRPDAAGAGLTSARMEQLCADTGVCSRGRVKALLLLLRWGGYLAPQAASADRRRRPLMPTAQMTSAYRSRWGRQLEIIAPLDPAAGTVAARLDDPAVFASLAVEIGSVLHAGFRLLDRSPALVPVAERDNGLLLCLMLALSGGPDGPCPPVAPFTVSIADLAARTQVSRSHARNLLAIAEREGLVARDAEPGRPERVRLTCRPLFTDALAAFFASTFAAMIVASRRVLEGDGVTLAGP